MRRLALGCLVSALTMTAGGGAAMAVPGARADAAVQVTSARDPFRAYASPVVAVDPRDARTIVVADGEARTSGCALQVSTDSGLSWHEASSPLPKEVSGCVRNTNGHIADVAFGRDGTLYYAFAGYPNPTDFHSKIYVARSSDLGRTF